MPIPRIRARYVWPPLILAAATGIALLGFALLGTSGGDGNGASGDTSGGPSGGASGGASGGERGGAEFVGRSACIECHSEQHDAWTGSHHDLAMQEPTEQTVLGDFDDATFTHQGVTSRFFREDGRFMVRTEGPDGKLNDYPVEYTFGVEPLQQYLLKLDGGRLQALTIAWDTEKQRWFHLHPDREIEPDSPLHWTGRLQNWNRQCASCHSTNLKKNYNVEADTYDTTYAEIDVSCEACHGPGSRHVDWARAGSITRFFSSYPGNYGLTTNLKSHYPDTTPAKQAAKQDIARADNQIRSCFMCHARRSMVHPDYTHGEPIFKAFKPQLLREPLYHPDGQINEEVYVFGSFTQSKMYHQGVACSDCHDPHTTKLKATGNALCLRCHDAGTYATKDHHFHTPGTQGASCADCHMPEKTYMRVDPRRDHSIRIPRPDLSAKLGTPNACNRCHTEQTAAWAAKAIEKHHGKDRPGKEPFAPVFAAGRDGEPEALKELVSLMESEDRPTIVRATALDLLRNYGQSEATNTIRENVDAEDPLMRTTALAALNRLRPADRIDAAAGLLDDPMRVVRMEAARILSPAPLDKLSEKQRKAFDSALAEYKAGQRALLDRPEGHMNLGNLYDNLGDRQKAVEHFKAAAAMGDELIPPRINLANLYNRMGRKDDAERLFREVIDHHPDFGEAHYSLGLLLAENPSRLGEATEHLARAAELMPNRPRVLYNYSLALQKTGRGAQAEDVLLRAHNLNPQSPDILNALVIYYAQRQRWDDAFTYARRLSNAVPNAPDPAVIIQSLRQRMQRRR